LLLSQEINTGTITGFCKGTPTSQITECLTHLKSCIAEIGHPLLFPVIIFSHSSSLSAEIKQREARDSLRKIEDAIDMRQDIKSIGYERKGVLNLNAINRDLMQCRLRVLHRSPASSLKILQSIERTMETWRGALPQARSQLKLGELQNVMMSRLEFYKKRLQQIEIYASKTLERLDTRKSSVSGRRICDHNNQ
jgi:hypothetical protein